MEYGLLLAGIAILMIVAILFLKDEIEGLFSDTGSSLQNPVGSYGARSTPAAGPAPPRRAGRWLFRRNLRWPQEHPSFEPNGTKAAEHTNARRQHTHACGDSTCTRIM